MMGRRRFQARKSCRFCAEKFTPDYKDFRTLQYYVTEHSKIVPRRISGNCAFHQRRIQQEVKRARVLALLPFVPPRD